MNPPQTMPLVPHVKQTANYHILLWVHHRVTSELRTCQHRSRPRVYAPSAKLKNQAPGGTADTGRMANGKKKRITQVMRKNNMMKNRRHRYLERIRNKGRNEMSMAQRSRRQLHLLTNEEGSGEETGGTARGFSVPRAWSREQGRDRKRRM